MICEIFVDSIVGQCYIINTPFERSEFSWNHKEMEIQNEAKSIAKVKRDQEE